MSSYTVSYLWWSCGAVCSSVRLHNDPTPGEQSSTLFSAFNGIFRLCLAFLQDSVRRVKLSRSIILRKASGVYANLALECRLPCFHSRAHVPGHPSIIASPNNRCNLVLVQLPLS
jgi:hypothetical protein